MIRLGRGDAVRLVLLDGAQLGPGLGPGAAGCAAPIRLPRPSYPTVPFAFLAMKSRRELSYVSAWSSSGRWHADDPDVQRTTEHQAPRHILTVDRQVPGSSTALGGRGP